MNYGLTRLSILLSSSFAMLLLVACEPPPPSEEQHNSAVKETKVEEKSGAIVVETDEELKKEGYQPPPSTSMNDDGATVDVNFVAPGALALPLADVGNMDMTDLISMKYLLQSIRICEDDSNQNPSTKCLEVYNFDMQKYPNINYDTFGYCEAKANDNLYVDLMDSEAIKRLSSTARVTDAQAGTYRYGYVNWFRPFKIKGVVKMFDGLNTELFTKDAPLELVRTGVDGMPRLVSKVSNITTGPVEEAVLFHNNGGAQFKFATPLTITKADVAAKKKYRLDLAFNPDKLITGAKTSSGSIWGTTANYPSNIRKDLVCPYPSAMSISEPRRQPTAEEAPFCQAATDTYSIEAPMIDLTPVIHEDLQIVMKDTYVLHYRPTTGSDFDVRVEIYTLKDDPAHGIYGVSIHSYNVSTSTTGAGHIKKAGSAMLDENGVLKILDYGDKLIFKNFLPLSAVGNAAQPLIYVGGNGSCFMTNNQSCHTDPTSVYEVNMTYELVSRVEL